MKIYYVFLLCCLVAVIPSASLGAGKLHTFTTPDGRSLNAKIKSYNDRTRKIQIEREDGKELWTLPTVFSESDQKYIHQWIAAGQFMSPTKFQIKGDSDKDIVSKSMTKIDYEITLENNTDFSLKELRIEYRAFIQKTGKSHTRVDEGQLLITKIPVGEKASLKAQPIDLITKFETVHEEDSLGYTTSYQEKNSREKLEGFWVKVYGPEVDGTPTVREWCNPPDTSENFAWQGKKNSNDPVYRTGSSSLTESDPTKALELFLTMHKKDPDSELERNIGYIYIWHLNPPNIPLGLEWLEKAAERYNLSACTLLAGCYSAFYGHPQCFNLKKTVKYGLRSAAINPRSFPHELMAKAYALDGQFDKAVEHQKIAVNLYKQSKNSSPEHLDSREATLELYQNNKTE